MVVCFSVNPLVRSVSKGAMARMDSSRCVPALDVVNTTEFRMNFGENVPAPGNTLAVRNLTFLFTDVADSTATYERRGDINAFGLVRDHFDLLFDLVRKHKGAVVKTIGDAVMASFQQPADAVACAISIREAFDEFNRLENVKGDSYLKIGVHGGPCVAVTLNKIMDYFGTTVNMSARIQALAGKREIILSQRIAQNPLVQQLLNEKQLLPRMRQVTLKGIAGPQTVFEL